MVGTGFALLQYGIENAGRRSLALPALTGVLAAAALLLVLFAWHARRVAAPAVDLTLFRNRSFRVGTLAGGLARVGMTAMPFLLPLMLQVGFGLSPLVSGSLTFVSAAGGFAVRPILSVGLRRYGFDRMLAWSAIAGAATTAVFALVTPATPHWVIFVAVFAFGLARATQFMTSNTLSYADMPGAQLSRATSLGGILQQLSVSFGVSIAALLLSLVTGDATAIDPGQFHIVFLLMAHVPLVAVPGFFTLRPEDGMHVSGHVR